MDNARNIGIIRSFRRWGFVMIAIPAIVVALLVGFVVRDIALDGYGGLISAGLNALIGESYRGEPFSADADPGSYQKLNKLIDARVDEGRLTAMTAVDPDGTVIYSSRPGSVGTTVAVGPYAKNALAGGTASSAVWSDDVGVDGERRRLLQVIAPIHYEKSKAPLGYLVAFRPYEAVSGAVTQAVAIVVGAILIGALAAYVLLLLLARAATRQVDLQERELDDLDERLLRTMTTIERHSLGTLQALSAAVDAKDSYTARHSLLVADYSRMIADRLDWDIDVDMLERAGLLHDIGKIGIPESILQKKELLKADEYRVVQEHSRIGADIIETIPFLAEILPAVLYHHERWDGRGYPEGLTGTDVPPLARILAAADAFDAMTSDRPYRPGLSMDAAAEELRGHKGTQFDPEVADALLALIEEGALKTTRSTRRIAV